MDRKKLTDLLTIIVAAGVVIFLFVFEFDTPVKASIQNQQDAETVENDETVSTTPREVAKVTPQKEQVQFSNLSTKIKFTTLGGTHIKVQGGKVIVRIEPGTKLSTLTWAVTNGAANYRAFQSDETSQFPNSLEASFIKSIGHTANHNETLSMIPANRYSSRYATYLIVTPLQ